MLLDRWRAQRAIRTRTAPTAIRETAPEVLVRAIEDLKQRLQVKVSVSDPNWHLRWTGDLQLVGLDARARSTTDVRQRLVRLWHELCLSHLSRSRRRIVAVILVAPGPDEDLADWHARLDFDRGEVGTGSWGAARRALTLLLVDDEGQVLVEGSDQALRRQVSSDERSAPQVP